MGGQNVANGLPAAMIALFPEPMLDNMQDVVGQYRYEKMCIGAALLARVPRVIFGVREPATGACESVFSIPNEPALEHSIVVTGGVEERRARELMQKFFRERRDEA